MLFRLLESFNNQPMMLFLGVVGFAMLGGGIPPIRERIRRRKIENALPSFLEALSDTVGAGLGIQEAMQQQAKTAPAPLGPLLQETLAESHVNSFDAALSSFATKTRSSQVQRVMHLLETAIDQGAPLQEILMNLSMDYERLNDLMNKRESELQGRGILIVLFICIGLPGLIGFLVGLFTPGSKGFQIDGFLSTFSLFFAVASAIGVTVSGRMLGRMRDIMWFVPLWMTMSMFFFLGATKMIGG